MSLFYMTKEFWTEIRIKRAFKIKLFFVSVNGLSVGRNFFMPESGFFSELLWFHNFEFVIIAGCF